MEFLILIINEDNNILEYFHKKCIFICHHTVLFSKYLKKNDPISMHILIQNIQNSLRGLDNLRQFKNMKITLLFIFILQSS